MRKTIMIALAVAALGSAASAADFDARIVNLDGSPVTDDKGKAIELTVRSVSVNALMTPQQDEPNLTGEEKLRRAELARRILTKDTAPLTAEDTALIKKLINKTYPSPLVVEQAWRALEAK
jgi:hypothetical protein